MDAIFITVRLGSTRFPRKALEYVNGCHAIERVIARAKLSRLAEKIVLCTTELSEDNYLWAIAKVNGIDCYRGSVKDKLERWRGAVELYSVDFFVTFDGDDLLCDPMLADLAFKQRDRNGSDFIEATNVPTGAFTYGISTAALGVICRLKGTDDTEMMVPYFKEVFNVEQLENVPDNLQRPEIRMTMDYPEDLLFFEKIYKHFGDTNPSLGSVIRFLDQNPEIIEINKHCQEKYLANQKKLTGVVWK